MTPYKRLLGAVSMCVLAASSSPNCEASVINLTDEIGALSNNTPTSFVDIYDTQNDQVLQARGGGIGDTYFISGDINSGSGAFRQLFKISGSQDQTSGYNRDGVFDSSVANGFMPVIRKSDLVTTSNGEFYIFSLDVNEPGNSNLISMDEFRIYSNDGSDPNPLPTAESDLDQLGVLRYSMNTVEQSTVLIDTGITGSGSGASDVLVFVHVDYLMDAGMDDLIYLYSAFGRFDPTNSGAWIQDSGFEEWSIPESVNERPDIEPIDDPIPEPSTSLLLSFALSAFLIRRSR